MSEEEETEDVDPKASIADRLKQANAHLATLKKEYKKKQKKPKAAADTESSSSESSENDNPLQKNHDLQIGTVATLEIGNGDHDPGHQTGQLTSNQIACRKLLRGLIAFPILLIYLPIYTLLCPVVLVVNVLTNGCVQLLLCIIRWIEWCCRSMHDYFFGGNLAKTICTSPLSEIYFKNIVEPITTIAYDNANGILLGLMESVGFSSYETSSIMIVVRCIFALPFIAAAFYYWIIPANVDIYDECVIDDGTYNSSKNYHWNMDDEHNEAIETVSCRQAKLCCPPYTCAHPCKNGEISPYDCEDACSIQRMYCSNVPSTESPGASGFGKTSWYEREDFADLCPEVSGSGPLTNLRNSFIIVFVNFIFVTMLS